MLVGGIRPGFGENLRIKLIILASFAAASVVYFVAIYGTIDGVAFCCDAEHYLRGGGKFAHHGMIFDHQFSGYRSIHNYVLVYLIERAGLGSYPVGALLLHGIIGSGLIAVYGHREHFLPVFAAIFLNPLSMAFVPVPLQESQMILVLGPLTVAGYVHLRSGATWATPALLLALAAAAWMIKGAFLLVAIPIAVVAVWTWWRARLPVRALAAGAVIAAAIIGPQVYVSWQKFETVNPYPATSVLSKQLEWGYGAWRYETDISRPNPRGISAKTPFAPINGAAEYFARMAAAPREIVALWFGHLVAAFDYSQIKPYITEPRAPFSFFNMLVGAVVFLGLSQWLKDMQGGYTAANALVDSIMLGSIVMLPLIAVENRFSLLALLVLTHYAIRNVAADFRTPGFRRGVVLATVFGVVFSTGTSFLIQP